MINMEKLSRKIKEQKMGKKETKLEVDPREVKRILTETRALLWLMCKYRWRPEQFKHVCYEELFDLSEMTKLLFSLDTLLAQFGIIFETEM